MPFVDASVLSTMWGPENDGGDDDDAAAAAQGKEGSH